MNAEAMRSKTINDILICDCCGRLYLDDDDGNQICECGRLFQRMEWASVGLILDSYDRLRAVMTAFRQWDQLDVAGDGPYWKQTIDAVLHSGPVEDS